MNRKIRFRLWDKCNSCFMPNDKYVIYPTSPENGAFGSMIKDWKNYNAGELLYDRDEFLMQFTGLLDKDGKEIYEGDILGGYPHGTCFVRWIDQYSCFESVRYEEIEYFDCESETKECSALLANDLNDCFDEWQVIGNIYENKNLLKGDSDAITR